MQYVTDPITGVLKRSDFSGIRYSDGDKVETRLLSVVTSASDVSIFSPELRMACTDWPSTYHLSPARANLLRPIADQLTGDVLELGAGCGAITRFLGENGANVLAVEGSLRRAAIARARTRDLDNVSVALDDIGQCPITQRFDAVTLIGVLEYAALFGRSDNPAQSLLERCRRWLKPGGVLVVAIENQVGLKYFAGAEEDHVGIANYGLENRYTPDGPRTYGRGELADLLLSAGVPAQKWYAPFPDYKLPAAVISDSGFSDLSFDAAALVAQTSNQDLQLPATLAFQPEPVWDVVCRNGLGIDLSNSFLVVAGTDKASEPAGHGDTLAWHFNVGRAAAYCKSTRFIRSTRNEINIKYQRLAAGTFEPIEAKEGPLKFDLAAAADYVSGRLLSVDFIELIASNEWSIDTIVNFFRDYLDKLSQLVVNHGLGSMPTQLNGVLDGRCFDWLPQNLMRTQSGDVQLIDQEWIYKGELPLDFLLFRAIRASLVTTTIIGLSPAIHGLTPRLMVQKILTVLGQQPYKDEQFEGLLFLEVSIQQQVHGGLFDEAGFRNWFDQPLSSLSRHLSCQYRAAQAGAQAHAEDLEQRLNQILCSRAWALTRPLRVLNDWITSRRSRRVREASLPIAAEAETVVEAVDIIVCVYNALEDVKCCFDSLLRNTSAPWRLIIVDDGSDTAAAGYLVDFAERHADRVRRIRHEQALGYTLAANAGLRQSDSHRVVLLNSDTVVTPGWLERLLLCAESDSRIGLVGPLSNCASWQSVPEVLIDQNGSWELNPLPAGWSVDRYSAQIAKDAVAIRPRVGFLNGFCLLIKRELVDAIGLFDETRFGRGYGEENDYCLRAAAAGWELAVADDCYVYHAQSKSYSDDRRAELAPLADAELHRKHALENQVTAQLIQTQFHPALEWVRANVAQLDKRDACRTAIREKASNRRILFVLPVSSISGGSNIVVLEVRRLRAQGVDAQLANIAPNQARFEACYPDLEVPINYLAHTEDVVPLAKTFDAVVATLFSTVEWLLPLHSDPQAPVLGYYIQDYEPAFFPTDDPEHTRAKASYQAIAEMRLFAKTDWTRQKLQTEVGVEAAVIGPSYDDDRFYPPAKWRIDAPVKVVAMVRPSTPRRAAALTMRVLKQIAERADASVQVVIFGVASDDPAFLQLERNFVYENRGDLGLNAVAALLREADIFVDASSFQAMGLTAMEAMASGAVVVGPLDGGLGEIIHDGETGLLVDTRDEAAIADAVCALVADDELRRRLALAGTGAVTAHAPESAVNRLLDALLT
jgi:GT2 family glycosyltransferase/glycosyltransferase involved in cell wall biosynthesis/SAM-dependent methyltransferase